MTGDLILPDRDPGPFPDPLGHGEWHRKVVAVLFEFGLWARGWDRSTQQAWWSEVLCPVCQCCYPRGEVCWFCPSEGVAA